jgi:hypothetical protein
MHKDNIKLGFLFGAIAPLLGIVGMKFWKFSAFTWREYFIGLQTLKPILTMVVLPSLVLNLIIMTYYLNKKLDKTARGIFIMTAVYGFIMAIVKLFA